MGFVFANQSTDTLPLPQGQSVDVRQEIGKAEFNRLMQYFPSREVTEESKFTPAEGTRLQEGLFEALVVAWSAPVPATLDNYRKLKSDDEVTIALDEALATHFKKMTVTQEEGKAPTTSPAE